MDAWAFTDVITSNRISPLKVSVDLVAPSEASVKPSNVISIDEWYHSTKNPL